MCMRFYVESAYFVPIITRVQEFKLVDSVVYFTTDNDVKGGQSMQYFTNTDKGETIPVHMESVSPSGNYFVGWHTKSRSIIHLYRKLSQTDDAVYGESMNYTSRGDDVGTSFSGVVWHEEYGFVKICFNNWGSFESESVRFYFDRDLYERKRKELHGEKQ